MKLTRVILSTCAVASSIVCISAYSVASSEPSVNFTVAKPCSQESAPKPKMEILEPLGPLHAIAEPDILGAFKSRVGAMKASGDYDRRFNQNKERIAKELEHPTPVTRLKKATELRVWELSASVPETLPDSLLRQARSVPMPHLSRSLLFIDGTDAESLDAAQKLYQSQKDMRVVLVNGFNPEDADERTALVKKHTAIELFRDFCRGAVHQNHPHVLLRLIELLSGTDRLSILPVNEEQ